MKQIVLQTIQEITAEKTKELRHPVFALRLEILKRLWEKADESLNELAANKVVKSGNTLNDKWFEL